MVLPSPRRSASHIAAFNVDPRETGEFDRFASRWWIPIGEARPLHDLNPAPGHVAARAAEGAWALDVGRGGGLLSEGLAYGAAVTAIDLAPNVIEVRRGCICTSRGSRSTTAKRVRKPCRRAARLLRRKTCMRCLSTCPIRQRDCRPRPTVQAGRAPTRPRLTARRSSPLASARIPRAPAVMRGYPTDYAWFIRPSEWWRCGPQAAA